MLWHSWPDEQQPHCQLNAAKYCYLLKYNFDVLFEYFHFLLLVSLIALVTLQIQNINTKDFIDPLVKFIRWIHTHIVRTRRFPFAFPIRLDLRLILG